MSDKTTPHHDPFGHGAIEPGPARRAEECGVDGVARLVRDLAHEIATTPEAVLAGMSDDVLKALFLLHVRHEDGRGRLPGQTRRCGRAPGNG